MSGKKISKAERRIILGQRRYVRRIRDNEDALLLTTESEKALRAASRLGK